MKVDNIVLDKISEIINIGIGRASSVLNKLVNNRVYLSVPNILILSHEEFAGHNFGYTADDLSAVSMKFSGEMTGSAEIIFPVESAVKIVGLLANKEYAEEEMDKLRSNSLTEVGNIVLNSLVGTIANMLKIRFSYKIPTYAEYSSDKFYEEQSEVDFNVILAETSFKVKEANIEGSFLLFFEIDSFENFVKKLETFSF